MKLDFSSKLYKDYCQQAPPAKGKYAQRIRRGIMFFLKTMHQKILTMPMKNYIQKAIDPLGLWFYQAQLAGIF